LMGALVLAVRAAGALGELRRDVTQFLAWRATWDAMLSVELVGAGCVEAGRIAGS
jgi:hypothetical protein